MPTHSACRPTVETRAAFVARCLSIVLLMMTKLLVPTPVSAATEPVTGPTLPAEERVPGGIALLDVGPATSAAPAVRYANAPVLVVNSGARWVAVVGLPLSAAVGAQQIEIDEQPLPFTIADKAYPTQPLTVDGKYVNPDPADAERIAREQQLMQQAFARFSLPLPLTLAMQHPAPGPLSSSFGLRRVFNGEARNPHSGLDIAATTGTPIQAPLPGKVVVTGNFYYNGNTVIIDHGGGLLSLYCHLDRIDATPDQAVEVSSALGTVGATGRVTGAHLHFSVSLNRARVNPTLFLTGSHQSKP